MSERSIMDALIAAGCTKEGAAAMLGNIWAESSCESIRVQGDYNQSRAKSKGYTAMADSGEMNEWAFSRDSLGYGLCQWTYHTRKTELYRMAKAEGKSIGDMGLQTEFLIKELKRDASSLWRYMCSSKDTHFISDRICREFERPAVNNYEVRRSFADGALKRYDSEEGEPESAESEYWPPRMVDRGMEGLDVGVLQSVLIAREPIKYALNVSCIYDELTEQFIKDFQKKNGLAADGVTGPLTWKALLSF